MTAAPPRNWAGNVTFRAARVHRPSSVAELQQIVARARSVRALGTGHSFNRIADTDGDLVRVDGLPGRVEIDAAALTATVPAGLRYAQVAEHLHAHGYALANLASLPQISVAGACATGTHGSGNRLPGLASAVAGLRMVAADGRLVELRRGVPEDRLDGAVVALGALGVVTDVTLDIEPTYDIAQWVYTGLPLDRLAGAFDALSGAAHSVSLFTDWVSGDARVWLKCRTDRDGSDHPGRSWQGAHLAEESLHPVPGISPAACTTQGGLPGPWHERLPHFRPDFTPSSGTELQSELLLPRTAAPQAVEALRRIGHRIAPVLQISEVRTVAADDLWLSPAHARDSVALHFTWTDRAEAVMRAVADVEEELLPLGGRPHWGKLTALAPGEVAALHPRAADFRRLMADHDPEGKLRNDFVRGVFPS
jgi:xylitol oxidase